MKKIPLQSLLNFLNTQLDYQNEIDLMASAVEFARFAEAAEEKVGASSIRSLHQITAWLLSRSPSDDFEAKRQLLVRVQEQLRSKVEKIISSTQDAEAIQNRPILEVNGTKEVFLDVVADRFIESFVATKLKDKPALGHENAELLADLAFIRLVQQLDLKPKSFGKCARTSCGNLFYQETRMPKKFCSNRCSGAERQEKFQTKKRSEKSKARKPKKPAQ
jgi:hypothetical protein